MDKVEAEALTTEEHPPKEPTLKEPAQRSAKKRTISPRSKEQSSAQVEELQARVRALEQELEAAKFKALYYSTIVRVAEQELGIAIEKKSSAISP